MWEYTPPDELFHHGIEGQKWGVRNGPPYPLENSQKSASEKKKQYKRWDVKPTESVGNVRFYEPRNSVRQKLGMPERTIKKSPFSKGTTDVYDSFHVFYNERNTVDAVEFFKGNKLSVDGKRIFPGSIRSAAKIISDLKDDGDGYVSRKKSIGITVSQDNPDKIEAVCFGKKGYYD